MKISEFLLRYNKADDEAKQKLVADHIKHPYVPYETKVAHCEMIAERTMMQDGKVKLNTPARYMLLIVVFIQDHMDLEYGDIDNVAMFNKMEEVGADDLICAMLDSEFKKYRAVLDMCVDDLLDRERNYVDFVSNAIDAFSSTWADIINGVEQFVKDNQAETPKVEEKKDG